MCACVRLFLALMIVPITISPWHLLYAMLLVSLQLPALVSLSLLGEEYLEKDIAIALCSLLLNDNSVGSTAGSMSTGKGQKNILEMGALGALNALAKSDEEDLQVINLFISVSTPGLERKRNVVVFLFVYRSKLQTRWLISQ